MDIHLITSDKTSFDLLGNGHIELNIIGVIVPQNRIKAEKVLGVIERAKTRNIPFRIH